MRGLIFLLATAMTCRAGYIGSSPYGHPLAHPGQSQQAVVRGYEPPAPVGEDGNVIDTPEVAHAKAAHFVEFARAAARAAQQPDKGDVSPDYHNPHGSLPTYSYPAVQPTAVPYLRQASYQEPTPIYQTANRVQSPIFTPLSYHQPQPEYDDRAGFVGQKSYALPAKGTTFVPAPLADDGTVLDTPEVAALKATRLAELAQAEAQAYRHATDHPEEHQSQVYSGPAAAPAPFNYNPGLGHYGSSRALSGPAYSGTQHYSTQQTHNPSASYGPHHYQSQHPVGTY